MKKELYIGLMSGTSIDAVDAALVDFSQTPLQLIATHSEPINSALKKDIVQLCQAQVDTINHFGSLDVKLGRLFANSVLNLLKKANVKSQAVCAIGSHGQTVRHMPNNEFPFTLQIGDPNIIAAATDITTVADFRRRDMALGGQAAPLAPAFHRYLLENNAENNWVLNIGGIANLTYLPAEKKESVIGFDTGPGNTLLDVWCLQHTECAFDNNGSWAAKGEIHQKLLTQLLSDPYFKKSAPKSTGREHFNLAWLENNIKQINETIKPESIQATLLELTAQSIADAIKNSGKTAHHIWVCGGGTHNKMLMQRLQSLCKTQSVQSTESLGLHPDWVEAVAFAWLAKQTINNKAGNLPSVTGAKQASVLGAIYKR